MLTIPMNLLFEHALCKAPEASCMVEVLRECTGVQASRRVPRDGYSPTRRSSRRYADTFRAANRKICDTFWKIGVGFVL